MKSHKTTQKRLIKLHKKENLCVKQGKHQTNVKVSWSKIYSK